ncbi:uncharacterized protein LOC133711847 [Rosa rugosa]|uniref:uncharacterized protein LOC133711847 n=1 Tax=Rosa rugosa TaxID=74645 RepID=UPI002B402DA7|nr:uncharacterized protein LOC133711847 [Rosa rugosa]
MADLYHRYAAPPERGSVAKSNFPGYLSSEAPSLLSNHTFAPTDLRSYSSDFLLRDKSLGSVPYGVSISQAVSFCFSCVYFCMPVNVSDLFRPFIGFKEIKVVHKVLRRSGDKAMVLCFAEFVDPKCALTAMEALQGDSIISPGAKQDLIPLAVL